MVTPERVQAQQPFSGIPLVLPDPPVLLDWGYDYSTHRLLTLVAPLEIVDAETEFLWVDTAPLGPAENHRSVVRFGIWAGCGH